jgi:uncharacterized membrane protein
MIQTWEIFRGNLPWMMWNGFLAAIPLPLAWFLLNRSYRTTATRLGIKWWFSIILLFLFLPNSAYVLTDIIHFVDDVRSPDISDHGIIFVLIPQYFVFIWLGFQCHVLTVMRWAKFCHQRWGFNVGLNELLINLVCAVGIYLGRFDRFNSWDLVTAPVDLLLKSLRHLTEFHFYIAVLVFWGTISALYAIAKPLSKGIYLYWKSCYLEASHH